MEWIYGIDVREVGPGEWQAVAEDASEATAFGRSIAKALAQMREALTAVVRGRMKFGEQLVPPVASDGSVRIAIPADLAAKASIYAAWKAEGITKVALAERMGRKESEVRRILDPNHGSKLDQLEEAARALGFDLLIDARKAVA